MDVLSAPSKSKGLRWKNKNLNSIKELKPTMNGFPAVTNLEGLASERRRMHQTRKNMYTTS